MYAICIEASHQRGMGHFYRALNLAALLSERDVPYVVLINDYPVALERLRDRAVPFRTVPLESESGWEAPLIDHYRITTWINDRLDTGRSHAAAVQAKGVRLVTFDDRGAGAEAADLHFAALAFDDARELKGKRVYSGVDYLVLDPRIERVQRVRTEVRRILVTLGGTDTYGVTLKAVAALQKLGRAATIIEGPGFQHGRELRSTLSRGFDVKGSVPSLIDEFAAYDFAITGGGMTAFEANASGLPCVIIANEWFEVPAGRYLERAGCSMFAGHHSQIDFPAFPEDAERMSRAGIAGIPTRGGRNVLQALEAA